jgi:general secretion pathway protein E
MNESSSQRETHQTIQLSFAFAKSHGVMLEGDNKIIYYQTPSLTTLQELRRLIGKAIVFEKVSQENFEELLVQHYQARSEQSLNMLEGFNEDADLQDLVDHLPQTEDLLESDNDAPIISLINAILREAIKANASDVHIETYEKKLSIRFRVYGMLREILSPPRAIASLIVSRIKVMSKLDIAEKRLPQDGRITLKIAGRNIDVRVSTLPGSHGERVVLRLLDKKNAPLDLRSLGMSEFTLRNLEKIISKPHGIILVTGPTGSGKSTTLYAILTQLNDGKKNILTVEDPIEYYFPGIGQTQVNYKIEMTFAKGLRAILRQDPDVVMIGEIRDLETAKIAVQASLTGHLLLSTLHTNTASGAIVRLKDMGVESFLLASSLSGLIAQRLIRLLCPLCKKAIVPDTEMQTFFKSAEMSIPNTVYEPVGCENCYQTGYKGRAGIYDLIIIDDKIRSMIHENASEQDIEDYARQDYPGLRQDGLRLVTEGRTSCEEIIRVTTED